MSPEGEQSIYEHAIKEAANNRGMNAQEAIKRMHEENEASSGQPGTSNRSIEETRKAIDEAGKKA